MEKDEEENPSQSLEISEQESQELVRQILRNEINASNNPENKSVGELIRDAADKRFDEKLGKITNTLLKAPIFAGIGVFLAVILNVLAPNIHHIWLDLQNTDAKNTIYAALTEYTDQKIDLFLGTDSRIDQYEKQLNTLDSRVILINTGIDQLNAKLTDNTRNLEQEVIKSRESISTKYQELEELRISIESYIDTLRSNYESDLQTIESNSSELNNIKERILSASDKANGVSSIIDELDRSILLYREAIETSDEFSAALAGKISNYLTRRKNLALERIFSKSIPVGTSLVFPISQSDMPDMENEEKISGSLVYVNFCKEKNLEFSGLIRLSYSISDAKKNIKDSGIAIKCLREK